MAEHREPFVVVVELTRDGGVWWAQVSARDSVEANRLAYAELFDLADDEIDNFNEAKHVRQVIVVNGTAC